MFPSSSAMCLSFKWLLRLFQCWNLTKTLVAILSLSLQLAPDDAWRCPHCQVLQQGTVKLSLWTLPDILIIHLKRFRQVGEQRHKLSTLVHFPLRGLDMAPHVAKRSRGGSKWGPWKHSTQEGGQCSFLYDLYAVCNHHGSMQGGHYTGEFANEWALQE